MSPHPLVPPTALAPVRQFVGQLLVLLLVLLACPWAQARSFTIGFAQSDTGESDWRQANTASFREAAKELGIELVFRDAGGKTAAQRRQVQELIDLKVDAIVLSANEVRGWDSVLLQARQARIPVLLADRSIVLQRENQGKGLYVTWIGSDFRYQGRAAGAWLAQESDGHCSIVEIGGPPDAAPSIERGKGFRDVIALFPGMQIVASTPGLWRTQQAKAVMQAHLKDMPERPCAVFAHNDNMAIGAAQAIEEARDLGLRPGKDILIIGVDAVRRGMEMLVDKKINALVECNPLIGKTVLQAALDVLRGRSFPGAVFVDERVFTVHNAAAALPLRRY